MTIIKSHQLGVTLVELMIVVALVAIIASIAYPSYTSHMNKTRNAEAQISLLAIMQQQRVYFTNNGRYSDDLITDLKNTEAAGEAGTVASEHGHYLISVGRCAGEPPLPYSDCVLLTATPTSVSAGMPVLTYNSKNQKGPAGHW